MTTRARAAGGATKEQFEGRVRKWVRQWTAVQGDKKAGDAVLKLMKWVQTDERTETPYGPRRPDIKPVADPRNKAVAPRARPKPKRTVPLLVKLSRSVKATTNNEEPTATEATEGAMAVDNDNEDVSQQPATSGGTETARAPTPAGTPPLEGGTPEADTGVAQPAQPLKLKLSRQSTSTPPLRPPDVEGDLMELD